MPNMPSLQDFFAVPANPVVQMDNQMNEAAMLRQKMIEQQAAAQMKQYDSANYAKQTAFKNEMERMKAEAYAKQVELMGRPKTKAETKKSEQEAMMLEMQNQYPVMSAIFRASQKNPNIYKEWINRPENESMKNVLGGEFDPDVMGPGRRCTGPGRSWSRRGIR